MAVGIILILTLLMAGFAAPAAWASCSELLRVEGPNAGETPRLTLTDCDVSVRLEGSGRTSRLFLDLREPAAGIWRGALGAKGELFKDLLVADLTVRSKAGGIPDALLLSSYSARGSAAHAWLWVDASATLRINPVDPVSGPQCPPAGPGIPVLWIKTLEVSPGSLITPRAYRTMRPGWFDPIAASCLTGWSLSDGAPARVHSALGLTVVAPDAPDGAIFELHARLSGQPGETVVKGVVRVTDPALHPLAGRWMETQEKVCDGALWRTPAKPIGEVVFEAGGAFSLAVEPFESYHDYWGTYRYERQSGALALNITGGNKVPSTLRAEGTARVNADGELLLEGLPPMDERASQPICARIFRRN
jgi:hypothetical protein